MKVELPREEAKATPTKDPDVVVVVTRTGEVEVRQQKLPMDKLVDVLRKEYQAKPGARLLVVADRKSYHGSVVKVMDIAKAVVFCGWAWLSRANPEPRRGTSPTVLPLLSDLIATGCSHICWPNPRGWVHSAPEARATPTERRDPTK